jgi:hypothetical protein
VSELLMLHTQKKGGNDGYSQVVVWPTH